MKYSRMVGDSGWYVDEKGTIDQSKGVIVYSVVVQVIRLVEELDVDEER